MKILPKLTYNFKAILIKIPSDIFAERNQTLTFMVKNNIFNINDFQDNSVGKSSIFSNHKMNLDLLPHSIHKN